MTALEAVVGVIYLVAAATFVIGLHLMRSPATARRGNLLSAAGMASAIGAVAANNGGTGAGAAGAAEAGADRAGVAAGAAMGSVLAQVASFVDPDLIVLGGELGCDPAFAATVAESFARACPSRRRRQARSSVRARRDRSPRAPSTCCRSATGS